MNIKRIISLLSAAAIAGASYVPVGAADNTLSDTSSEGQATVQETAAESWTEYIAAYDAAGRLLSIKKSSDIDPSAVDTMIDFKMLKTFVWDSSNKPYADESTVVLDAECFKTLITASGGVYQLQMYSEDKLTYDTYNLSADAVLYANGYEITEGIESFFNSEYVIENNTGKIKLSDMTDGDTSEPDGIYDTVYVSYYVEGVVDEVDSAKKRIYFSRCDDHFSTGQLELDGNQEYSIKLNGKEITVEELMPGDVLSIAYDIRNEYRDASKYDILVSRNKFTGMVRDIYIDDDNPINNTYTFEDGGTYRLAHEYTLNLDKYVIYDVYMDIFGRIAYAEENYELKNYALLENVYLTNGGADAYADIVGSDGIKISYRVSSDDYESIVNILMNDFSAYGTDAQLANRRPPQERVIEYVLTSEGEFRLKGAANSAYFSEDEFDPLTGKLGGRQLSEDITSIINITDYKTDVSQGYDIVPYWGLKSKTEYSGYAYGAFGTNRTYKFVLLTSGAIGNPEEDDILSEGYALLENIFTDDSGEIFYAEITRADGTQKTYQINNQIYHELASVLLYNPEMIDFPNRLVKSPWERVIRYAGTARNELRYYGVEQPEELNAVFDADTNTLGEVQLSEAGVSLLDISRYYVNNSYFAVKASMLLPGEKYSGYVFGKIDSENKYQLVLICEGVRAWHVENPWAVFVRNEVVDTNNGERDGAVIMSDGLMINLPLRDGSLTENMSAGDVFFYKLNSDREIDEIRMVTSAGAFDKSYQDFYNEALNAEFDILDSTTSAQFAGSNGDVPGEFRKDIYNGSCELVAGPIVDVANEDVMIATPAEVKKQSIEKFSIDRVKSYWLADDVNVYRYDYSVMRPQDRISVAGIRSIRKSSFQRDSYVGDKIDNIVNFRKELELTKEESEFGNANCGNVNFAVAKIINKEITEIVVIIPDPQW